MSLHGVCWDLQNIHGDRRTIARKSVTEFAKFSSIIFSIFWIWDTKIDRNFMGTKFNSYQLYLCMGFSGIYKIFTEIGAPLRANL